MPGEVIDRPNPQPLPSHLPDGLEKLSIKLSHETLDPKACDGLFKYRRAAAYIAAAMIFLQDNTRLERDLTFDDVKPRLLGHWGTCPGLILVYSHLNYLIRTMDLDMLYVVGPGHGAPAILAALWLEGSLEKFYPQYSRDNSGLHRLISTFSTTAGFPSHINAETPGAIHEGGELGYALSVSFGAVMDNPNLIVTCVVGDGEAESGPTATSWHAIKYIDPKESGAVLPILHLNGFKISERTIFGCMDQKELLALFSGYGYQVRFVEDLNDIDTDLHCSMVWAVEEIRKIQAAARAGRPILKPRWPMLILRTPKGWSGPRQLHGQFIEGSFHSHQVPLPKAKTDKDHLDLLQKWLADYKPGELFTRDGDIIDEIKTVIPADNAKKLGQRIEVHGSYIAPKLPDWKMFGVQKGQKESAMQAIGKLINEVFVLNPHSVRLFSPDELESNKLDAVFDQTGRNFQWDEFANARGGRVIEVLSEHMCQGFMQGYTLTGRVGIFPSYESFLGIIHTMMVQYAKFIKMVSCSRNNMALRHQQHQLHRNKHLDTAGTQRILAPEPVVHRCRAEAQTNRRTRVPATRRQYLPDNGAPLPQVQELRQPNGGLEAAHASVPDPQEAENHCRAGASVWKFCSTDEGLNPDVVLVGIGVEVMFEVIEAAALLRRRIPALRVRVINVTDLMILENEGVHPHALSTEAFDNLFTADRPIHFNYHGYPTELQGLLWCRPRLDRISIAGYMEEGSTTTPFDMMLANRTSRFHVAKAALRGAARRNEKVQVRQHELATEMDHDIVKTRKYIIDTHKDPDDMYAMPKFD
ncbi:hypothetical protein NUU61_003267 [Penicillium alfredii]|uniref:Phosphoketolase n=1 Tax=Penicillium alfredii TaxID=1506179 RepID=A0A9W9FTQ9_9EURO|nr:uncharacterized protein NUU61_003267 [Penicillium alfredii]KAJ5105920.1 hypothetical protein NUU61_003267 [Penicillium alfredii]